MFPRLVLTVAVLAASALSAQSLEGERIGQDQERPVSVPAGDNVAPSDGIVRRYLGGADDLGVVSEFFSAFEDGVVVNECRTASSEQRSIQLSNGRRVWRQVVVCQSGDEFYVQGMSVHNKERNKSYLFAVSSVGGRKTVVSSLPLSQDGTTIAGVDSLTVSGVSVIAEEVRKAKRGKK